MCKVTRPTPMGAPSCQNRNPLLGRPFSALIKINPLLWRKQIKSPQPPYGMMSKIELKAPSRPKRMWNIGYGSLSKERFLHLMRTHNINIVVDVRRWPASKIDHFKKENLESLLQGAGIKYVWLGDKLGGFRKGGYRKFMDSPEFEEGIRNLISLSESGNLCFLCLEPDPKRCHRRYIIERLSSLGFEISNIEH